MAALVRMIMEDFYFAKHRDEKILFFEESGYGVSLGEIDLDEEILIEIIDFTRKLLRDSDETWSPPQPASDAYIWRYLNFTQLLSIFERDQIWFTNVTGFEDPYEGTIPKANFESEVNEITSEFDIADDTASRIHTAVRGPGKTSVSGAYVNCWNVNEHQSAALWEQYIDSPEGIAIRTTVDQIYHAMDANDYDLTFGNVEYIDYDEDMIPYGDTAAIYHKRQSFEHEREFRISYLSQDSDDVAGNGFYVDVDTEILIDRIVISPIAPDWFSELVYLVLEQYELDCEVKESGLYSGPDALVK